MKVSRALVCVAVLGALATLAIGCGSETVSKAEFVEQANAICEKAEKERQAAATKALEQGAASGQALTKANTEKIYVEVILPSIAQMTDELEDLDQPDSGGEGAEALVEALRTGIETGEADPGKVVGATADPFQDVRKKARAYGLEGCDNF